MFAENFARLATGFTARFGGPFVDAIATWDGVPVKDDGGSIVTPGTPVIKSCQVQFDAPTQAMRNAEGFRETDARILVLAGTLDGALDGAARITTDVGQNDGSWELLSIVRDPAGIGFECRARKI
jgi:hypothetical protein